MNKVLILGKTGMAGHVIYSYLKERISIVDGTSREKDSDIKLDILDNCKIMESNEMKSYDYIINCIGILIRESNIYPTRAILINSWFPHYLEDCFKDTNTKIIHISTDCVFSGKTGFYKESSTPDEINFYGRSKYLGEIINKKDLTIRTSIIGPELKYGDGLFDWFMRLTQNEEIKGYVNSFWNGITTLELAKAIEEIISDGGKLKGLYHLVPRNAISKCTLLDTINQIFDKKIIIKPFRLPISSNKVLMDTRNEFKYAFHDYYSMINSLKYWILNNSFPQYAKYKEGL